MNEKKKKYQTWYCKVGIRGDCSLPAGADQPMRMAIKRAFEEVTGLSADFCFSGWNSEDHLTDVEKDIVEDFGKVEG